MPEEEPFRFESRIAVVLHQDLLQWQELNVVAFLASGITASARDLTGEPYEDANGNRYLAMLREPVIVLVADGDALGRIRERALARELSTAIYTRELFSTGHDGANRAAVAAVGATELDLVGVGLRGPRNVVDRIVKGTRKHS